MRCKWLSSLHGNGLEARKISVKRNHQEEESGLAIGEVKTHVSSSIYQVQMRFGGGDYCVPRDSRTARQPDQNVSGEI